MIVFDILYLLAIHLIMASLDLNVDTIFDDNDASIRSDVLRMIVEHLNREKLFTAANILEDELNTKLTGLNAKRVKMAKFHKAVLYGDWDMAIKQLGGLVPKSSQKHFHYHLFRQQYVELIDAGDRDTAFRFLNDNIKPLEHVSSAQGPSGYCEFKELCYLLTCKAVGEAEGPFFRTWRHYSIAREQLADQLVRSLFSFLKEECGIYDLCPPQMLSYDAMFPDSASNRSNASSELRGTRLLKLLKQSYAYQIMQQRAEQAHTILKNKVRNEVRVEDKSAIQGTKLSGNEDTSTTTPNTLSETSNPPAVDISSFTSIHIDSVPSNKDTTSVHTTTNKSSCEALRVVDYPCVRSLAEDFRDDRLPSRLLGILVPPTVTSASSAEKPSFPHTHAFASMAFANGKSGCEGSLGTVLCGTDKGTIFEYNYPTDFSAGDESSRLHSADAALQTNLFFPRVSISLPGVSSFDGLQVESCSASTLSSGNSASGICKRNTNVKIRDISLNVKSSMVCVGSSDGTLTLLRRGMVRGDDDVHAASDYELLARSNVHEGDCYATFMHPSGESVVSGGFDHNVAVYDVQTSSVVKIFKGHDAPVTRVGANRPGNLVLSSSKDGTVRFWDLLSGGCVKVLSVGTIGRSSSYATASSSTRQIDITSASLSTDGLQLLVSTRFRPSRVIDLRTDKEIAKFIDDKGMAGSIHSFYVTSFCGNDTGVVCGGLNGTATIWSSQTGKIIRKLQIPSTKCTGLPQSSVDTACCSEVIRCVNDRFSNVVGTVTTAGIGIWGH